MRRWLDVRGDADGPLFNPVRQSGEIPVKRLGGESVTYILKRRQEQAEVDQFSPHDLRRANVTALLDAGVDVFTVQKLAGHADASTTARYDRRGKSAKRLAVERLECAGGLALLAYLQAARLLDQRLNIFLGGGYPSGWCARGGE